MTTQQERDMDMFVKVFGTVQPRPDYLPMYVCTHWEAAREGFLAGLAAERAKVAEPVAEDATQQPQPVVIQENSTEQTCTFIYVMFVIFYLVLLIAII